MQKLQNSLDFDHCLYKYWYKKKFLVFICKHNTLRSGKKRTGKEKEVMFLRKPWRNMKCNHEMSYFGFARSSKEQVRIALLTVSSHNNTSVWLLQLWCISTKTNKQKNVSAKRNLTSSVDINTITVYLNLIFVADSADGTCSQLMVTRRVHSIQGLISILRLCNE